MARSTLLLTYTGSAAQYVLDVTTSYRRKIAKIFTPSSNTLDVSGFSPEGLQVNPTIGALLDAGTFTLTLTPGSSDTPAITASAIAPQVGGVYVATEIRVPIVAAVGGTADDVTFTVPFACRIVSSKMVVLTTASASNVTLRTAAAGAGSVASGTLSTAAAGPVNQGGTAFTATQTFAAGATVYARRSDNTVAGELFVTLERV